MKYILREKDVKTSRERKIERYPWREILKEIERLLMRDRDNSNERKIDIYLRREILKAI